MKFMDKQQELPTFELAYRIGYLGVMIAILSVLTPIMKTVQHEQYFLYAILGTVSLLIATIPLGHSPLGGDVRGVIGYALVFEVIVAVSYIGDGPSKIYSIIAPYYRMIESGFWAVIVGRMMWPYASVGWPIFDFVRPLFFVISDHRLLSTRQKFCGYFFIGSSFLVGSVLGLYKLSLNFPVIFAIPCIMLLVSARSDHAAVSDRD